MKYRILATMGMLALTAGALQAQDYDDIYYDASKSPKTTKVSKPVKTVAVYGEVPENYKVAAQSNYRVERDEDEYNRRGPSYETDFEVDINGDTIYFDNDTIFEEAFANTRRIERFYNPDIVILSDDDDLVELYYDESPTINLVIGSEYSSPYFGWGYSSYFPWYTGWYEPWYTWRPWHYGWYSSWYGWYSPWRYSWYGPRLWGWNYWGYSTWHGPHGWDNRHWSGWQPGSIHPGGRPTGVTHGGRDRGGRVGLASNRNGRNGINGTTTRNGVSPKGRDHGMRGTGVTTPSTRSRGGYATGRSGGNMGTRSSSSAGVRSSGGSVSRSSSGSRSYSGGSSYGGSRSSGSSYSGGSRSSGSSYSGGSRSSGGGSYSGGSSGGGSHSGGGGGGSHGGSSGGGGHRR